MKIRKLTSSNVQMGDFIISIDEDRLIIRPASGVGAAWNELAHHQGGMTMIISRRASPAAIFKTVVNRGEA